MAFTHCNICPDQCEPVFDRVVVSYVIAGGTRVMWDLLPSFTDPGPYVFQLQVGRTADNNANDWENVGLPVDNSYVAVDPAQRVWGKTNWSYYRVLLTTGKGAYVSQPTGGMGTLDQRDWLTARELLRMEVARMRVLAGQEGYLLKRRVSGQKCKTCLDFQTEEVRNPDCPSCYGTGFECGYFYPMACVWADFSPKSRRLKVDDSRATVDDIVVQARMTLTDLLVEDDVFVNRRTDERYFVHKIDHVAEYRGVPLVGTVEMRPIPFSSVIYDITIPDQLRRVGNWG